MNHSRNAWTPWLGLSLIGLCSVAHAEQSAAEISQKSRDRGALNLVNVSAELKLITLSKDGRSKEQVLTSSSRKVDGKNRSLARFSQPAGVAGVAVLTVEGEGGEDEISLFLPKLKRVRKVAKGEKGKAFMDTDFSYADLGNTGAKDSEMKRLPDEKVDGRPAWVITGTAGPDSPYSEITVAVDQQTYVPLRAEYLDKDHKPLKRYHALKLKKFQERTLAAEATMENLQTGSKTTMQVLRLEEAKLGDDAYTERALERG